MRAGAANFSKMHSMILGTTPLKTKSQRRLFGTPAITSPAAAATTPVPTSVVSSPITATTKAGTLVKHVKLAFIVVVFIYSCVCCCYIFLLPARLCRLTVHEHTHTRIM